MKNNQTLKKPHKHQEEAIEQVFSNTNGLNHKDRTQLIMACGTGKTFTSLKIAEKNIIDNNYTNSITIMLFPSLYLINQTKVAFSEDTTIHEFKKPLVICSDITISENESEDIMEIEASEVDYKVTTDYNSIVEYISSYRNKNILILSTYQSSHLLGKALLELNISANLTIFDEAHKTANNSDTQKGMNYPLIDANFPSQKRLFMTATSKVYKWDDEADENETIVFSMDNEEVYGNISYEYPMRRAINEGIISDYKIVGIFIDKEYMEISLTSTPCEGLSMKAS